MLFANNAWAIKLNDQNMVIYSMGVFLFRDQENIMVFLFISPTIDVQDN